MTAANWLYVSVNLVTFDEQSNARRMRVESNGSRATVKSKSNKTSDVDRFCVGDGVVLVNQQWRWRNFS